MVEMSDTHPPSMLSTLPIPPIESLDLTAVGVLRHFADSGRRAQLVNYLVALDRADQWAVDFNEMSSPDSMQVQLFLQDLSRFVESSADVLHRVPLPVAELLSHLTTTRCMYLIRYISQSNPDFLDNLAFLIESNSAGNADLAAIRRRFEAFSKGRLLGEIFSGKRLERIVSIMGSYGEDKL